MENIEHIGIAVADEAAGVQLFTTILGTQPYKTEEVEKDGVKTIFYLIGTTKIELLVPTRLDSPIQKFIDKNGPGIHHIAFGVKNGADKLKSLIESGVQAIDTQFRPGADGKEIAFLHPKSSGGVLVELCQDRL